MQNEHILLHPLIIDTNVDLVPSSIVGKKSSYVSSQDSSTSAYFIFDL